MKFFNFLLTLCLILLPTYEHQTTAKGAPLNIEELLNTAKETDFFDWLTSIRRKISEYPELSFEEYKRSELIRPEPDSLGVEYIWPVAKTGLVATIGSGDQPWFALRANMDVLPIQVMDLLHVP